MDIHYIFMIFTIIRSLKYMLDLGNIFEIFLPRYDTVQTGQRRRLEFVNY